MSCEGCGRNGVKLFEVIESSWKEYTISRQLTALQRRSIVCGQCLVGRKPVPVRRSIGTWQMGEVVSYNRETHEHRVLFDVNDQETLSVSSKPFLDCAATNNNKQGAEKKCSANLDLEKDDGKASVSTPSRPPKSCYTFEHDGSIIFHRDGPLDYGLLRDEHNFDDTRVKMSYETGPEFPDSPINDSGSWMPSFAPDREIPALQLENCDQETTDKKRSSNEVINLSSPEEQIGSPKKMCPRLWTPAEDQLLLDSIDGWDEKDLKWPLIAQSVPGRSGKQCRERYLNHLQPDLRGQKTNWSPTEDALICHMNNNSIGWSATAKLLQGRSDNGVKNRYHAIRRKLEKLLMLAPKSPSDTSHGEAHGSAAKTTAVNEKLALLDTAVDAILKARNKPEAEASSASKWQYEYDFSFSLVDSNNNGLVGTAETICQRCGLLVPSPQTGRAVCRKTGWCESCASAPPYLSENFLRKLHMANTGNADTTNYATASS